MVGLEPAQHHRRLAVRALRERCLQRRQLLPQVFRVVATFVFGAERLQVRQQQTRDHRIDDAPQVSEPVFHRCAGHGDDKVAVKGLCRVGHQRAGRLDALHLVEDDRGKAHGAEAVLIVAHRLVSGEHPGGGAQPISSDGGLHVGPAAVVRADRPFHEAKAEVI